jgi:hypothetical protein
VVDAGQFACEDAVLPFEQVTLVELADDVDEGVAVAEAYCTHCPVVELY